MQNPSTIIGINIAQVWSLEDAKFGVVDAALREVNEGAEQHDDNINILLNSR